MVEDIAKIGSEVKNVASTNEESSGSKRLFMKSKLTSIYSDKYHLNFVYTY